jgi:hypothetical protein
VDSVSGSASGFWGAELGNEMGAHGRRPDLRKRHLGKSRFLAPPDQVRSQRDRARVGDPRRCELLDDFPQLRRSCRRPAQYCDGVTEAAPSVQGFYGLVWVAVSSGPGQSIFQDEVDKIRGQRIDVGYRVEPPPLARRRPFGSNDVRTSEERASPATYGRASSWPKSLASSPKSPETRRC